MGLVRPFGDGNGHGLCSSLLAYPNFGGAITNHRHFVLGGSELSLMDACFSGSNDRIFFFHGLPQAP